MFMGVAFRLTLNGLLLGVDVVMIFLCLGCGLGEVALGCVAGSIRSDSLLCGFTDLILWP